MIILRRILQLSGLRKGRSIYLSFFPSFRKQPPERYNVSNSARALTNSAAWRQMNVAVDMPELLPCRDGDSLSACGLGLELAAGALSSLKEFRCKFCGTPVASKAPDVKAISRSQVFQWLSRLAISPKPILLAGEQQRDTDSLLRHTVFKRREDQQVGSRHGRFPQESACGPTGEVFARSPVTSTPSTSSGTQHLSLCCFKSLTTTSASTRHQCSTMKPPRATQRRSCTMTPVMI